MSGDLMLKCLIAFILGWIIARMMGHGFSVGSPGVLASNQINPWGRGFSVGGSGGAALAWRSPGWN